MVVKRTAVCCLLLLSLMTLIAAAKGKEKKPIEWRTGTLLDVSSERITGRADMTRYTIDDGQKYIYVLTRKLTMYWDKELAVTVKRPVKFAIVGDEEFLLLDEKGKAHKLSLQKRSLRTRK